MTRLGWTLHRLTIKLDQKTGSLFGDANRLHGVALFDRVHDVLAFDHFPKDAVTIVQVRLGFVSDEELGAVGIGSRVGHRQDTGSVVLELWMKFIFELISGTTTSAAFGTPALDHEVGDDAVEAQTVVKLLLTEILEVLHSLGSLVIKQLDTNCSAIGIKRGYFHQSLFRWGVKRGVEWER